MPPHPVIISQGFPHPYPIHIPADWKAKGSGFTGAFSSQARVRLPGQRGALAPGEALLTISHAVGSLERDSVQLEVTQLLGGGRAQAPGQINKLVCSLQIPSAEAAGAEDELGHSIVGLQAQDSGGA